VPSHVVRGCDVIYNTADFVKFACCKRKPRDESDTVVLTSIKNRLGLTVCDVVTILDRRHIDVLAGSLQLFDGDVAQADQVDESLVLELGECLN